MTASDDRRLLVHIAKTLDEIRDLLRQQVRPFDQRIDDLRKSNAAVDCSVSSLLHTLDNLEQRIEVGARLGIAHRDSSPTSSGDTGEGSAPAGSAAENVTPAGVAMTRLKRLVVAGLETLCATLDLLPAYDRENRRWYRPGQLGCLHNVARLSVELDDKWGTGVWK